MQSIFKENNEASPDEYPCLKKYSNKDGTSFIVLFHSNSKGIIVFANDGHAVGTYSTGWDENHFTKVQGVVELSN